MKRQSIIIFWLFLAATFFVNGVDSLDVKLDALNKRITSETKSTVKVDLLLQKSELLLDSDFKQAERILIKAELISNDIGYNEGLLKSSAQLANIYTSYSADFFKAMKFSSSALLLSKNRGDKVIEVQMYQNISFIFSSLKDTRKAISYAEKAYTIALSLDDNDQLAKLNTLLGGYYETMNDTSKMLNHYGAVNKLYALDSTINSTKNLLSIAKFYSLKENYDMAGKYYDMALAMSKGQNDKKNFAVALTKTASYYLAVNDINKAFIYIRKGLRLTDSISYLSEQVNQYKVLAKIYQVNGNYKEATVANSKYYLLRDSLYNEKISTQIFIFEDDFKTLLKENELQALKDKELATDLQLKNEQLRRNLLIGGLLFVFISAIGLYSRLRITKKLNKQLLDQKGELERLSIVASDINNAVIIITDERKVEWVNKGYSAMSGYEIEDIEGIDFFDLADTSQWEQEKLDYAKQLMHTQEVFEIEVLSQKKNGDSYWLNVSVTPSFDSSGKILKYIIVASDITSKKEANIELNSSYESARLLSEIGVGITAAKTVEDIVDLVYSKINELLDATCFGFGLVDNEKNELNFVSFIEKGQKYKQVSCSLDQTDKMGVVAVQKNKAFLINDFEVDHKEYLDKEPGVFAGELTRSVIYIPLWSKKQTIGVLTVQSFKKNAYQENHFNLAKNIANYVAIAIEKTILYQGMEKEVDKRTEEIVKQKDQLLQTYSNTKLLSEIGLDISSTLNFDEVFETVHTKIGRLMDVEMFGIRIYHEDLQQIEYNYEIESGELDPLGFMTMEDKNNYTVWCIENEKDIFINDNDIEYANYIDSFKILTGKSPKSLIFTPMFVEGKVVGVLTVQSMKVQAFERHHLDLLKSLGAYVASALVNGSLYSTLETKVEQRTKALAEKNKNITDSINYAKRIQDGILPSDKLIHALLPKSFVYFQPKDIVSGDFYWMTEKNGKIFVAVVDCTGHGVPGAFMSIIGESLLEQAINEPYITRTNQILDYIQEGLQKLFEQESLSEGYNEIFDGMDMSLVAINMHKKRIEYSGACNSLFKVHDNKVERLRGDKFGISAVDYGFKRPFSSSYVDFEAGDAFYIFSDGFPDQFGGPKTKKFGYKNTCDLLARISTLPVEKQQMEVVQTIEEWQGNIEQTDDICMFGFKI